MSASVSNPASANRPAAWAARLRRALRSLIQGSPLRGLIFFKGSERSGSIALTFDDGPHPVYTPMLLDLLAGSGAQATFFLVGRSAREHPGIVRRIVEEGHLVASHTDSHCDLSK